MNINFLLDIFASISYSTEKLNNLMLMVDYIDEYDDKLAEVYEMVLWLTEELKASEVDFVRPRLFKWINKHFDADDAYELMNSACYQLEDIKKQKKTIHVKKKDKTL